MIVMCIKTEPIVEDEVMKELQEIIIQYHKYELDKIAMCNKPEIGAG